MARQPLPPPPLPSRSLQYVRPGGEAEVDAGIPTFVDGVHVRGGLAELEPPTDELIASLRRRPAIFGFPRTIAGRSAQLATSPTTPFHAF